ncbi:hypothetical protein [Roseibium litorale]|uniref:Uncharacterized protein n=1 Tax=Roseibium litorale TaxID=2803841 RepID=A0ABR9CLR8_9HYPH|nr:hypothetical protein [Roseibium litorale]MBD8891509.1 hypothetical protein [Roseibium litorale]
MPVAFVSFASKSMGKSLKRIGREARGLKVFDRISLLTEDDLDPAFRLRFADKLTPNVRGFGYWIWKPQAVLQELLRLQDGDLLVYADAGCHLNPGGVARLKEYLEIAASAPSGILAFQLRAPDRPDLTGTDRTPELTDSQWIKGDLVDHFGVRDQAAILETPTIVATTFVMRKCPQTLDFLRKWIAVFEADFSLIDDTPSKSENLEGFIEHRHDQAIFSILCKLTGVATLSHFENYFPAEDGKGLDLAKLASYPIQARRLRQYSPWFKLRKRIAKRFAWLSGR